MSQDTLDLIPQAAALEDRSVSDFVVSVAREAANRTIRETAIVSLCREDMESLIQALEKPPESSPAIRRAVEHHRRLVGEPCGTEPIIS